MMRWKKRNRESFNIRILQYNFDRPEFEPTWYPKNFPARQPKIPHHQFLILSFQIPSPVVPGKVTIKIESLVPRLRRERERRWDRQWRRRTIKFVIAEWLVLYTKSSKWRRWTIKFLIAVWLVLYSKCSSMNRNFCNSRRRGRVFLIHPCFPK